MTNRRQIRKGSIPIVIGLVCCLGVFAYASIFMTSTGARMEHRAELEQIADTVAQAAIEETLVKLQNTAATWAKQENANDQAERLEWPAAATAMMYEGNGVKVAPVKVLARPLNIKPENDAKNRYYSRFSGLPNYHPQHQADWESKLPGSAASLVRAPEGVTVEKGLGSQVAGSYKDDDSELRTGYVALPVLAAGRDHSDSELAEFKQKVNGNTELRELASEVAPRAQQAPVVPGTLQAPGAAGAQRSGRGVNPRQGQGLSAGVNQAAQATANAGCAGQVAANGATQGPLAAAGATNSPKRISPTAADVRAISRDADNGGVFHSAPVMVTLQTQVTMDSGIGMHVQKTASAQRVVSEMQFKDATSYLGGRILGYWIVHNNLTVNDLFRMGWVDSTRNPKADFTAMFPDTEGAVPAEARQVWPFSIANADIAAKAK